MSNTQIFIPPGPLSTAVLFLVFNRFDTTKEVFESIRKAKPPRLYIASDGAREFKNGEVEKVKSIRDYVMTNIDWECDVKTLFRDKNLGCKHAVSSAITWFFENEEQGIILEDDCLPSQSFFWFCEESLNKYKNDLRVWHISGNNFHFGWQRDKDYSYYFSYYGSIWGWASWRSRWQHYTVDMVGYKEMKDKNYLWDLFGNQQEANFRTKNFDSIVSGYNTWDYQWVFTRFLNSGLSIVPSVNLIKNIGFGEDATHTKEDSKWAQLKSVDLSFPLKHPKFCIRDKVSDDAFLKDILDSSITSRLQRYVKKYLSFS